MAELSPSVASVRKRPGMYVGDTGEYGLYHLVYFLLDAAAAEARGSQLQQLIFSLGEDGGVELLEDGRPVPPDELPDLLTRWEPHRATDAYEPLRFESLCVFALSEHFELEAWDGSRQWRLRGQAGVLLELPTPEPRQEPGHPGPRGTRVRFIPDRTLFEPGLTFNVRRLHLRCRELAALTPGLSIHFRSPRLQDWLQYPLGLGGLVQELTEPQLTRLQTPIMAEAQWEDVQVRCALQWSRGPDCQVWSFANTVRTRKGGHHVDGALDALGAAVGRMGRRKKPRPHASLLPGLTLVVAVDGPRSRMVFAGPTKDLLATEGLREGVASALTPVLERALRDHDTDGVPWIR
ncbi:DNA topoisomerase IV subunit B family protein [Hyalangium gracile]|uniref:DNA gyrase subunit B n=1 Tax=Hyalangium gracile TaxID=394092 RepID=UPI001CCE0A11|nr:DNA gyrase subunit B [Hyalangium gracile]